MINLLPRSAKRELYAGRTNVLLVRYNILMIIVIAAVALILAGVYLYLMTTLTNAERRIEESERSGQQLATEQQEIASFKSNLATAKQILDKRVDYSTVILRISSVVPGGVLVDQLSLDPETFGTPTKLNVSATSEQRVLELKNALNESEYFDDAYIDTITKAESGDHPYAAVLTVTFKQELLQ